MPITDGNAGLLGVNRRIKSRLLGRAIPGCGQFKGKEEEIQMSGPPRYAGPNIILQEGVGDNSMGPDRALHRQVVK